MSIGGGLSQVIMFGLKNMYNEQYFVDGILVFDEEELPKYGYNYLKYSYLEKPQYKKYLNEKKELEKEISEKEHLLNSNTYIYKSNFLRYYISLITDEDIIEKYVHCHECGDNYDLKSFNKYDSSISGRGCPLCKAVIYGFQVYENKDESKHINKNKIKDELNKLKDKLNELNNTIDEFKEEYRKKQITYKTDFISDLKNKFKTNLEPYINDLNTALNSTKKKLMEPN
jgi:hypothetical protein